jgi:CRP/FNR family nitrogen fixation transcriptional regulator
MLIRTSEIGGTIKSTNAAVGKSAAADCPVFAMGTTMSFGRDAEIYGEGEPSEFLYKVISGAVRTCKVLADGRRQVGSFYLPGDVFGLEATDDHAYSAEAVTASRIVVTRRIAAGMFAARDGEAAHKLVEFTSSELERAQSHLLLLIKSAQERVVSFLMEMAKRGASPEFDLPMSRQDIADYLGLTIETVSRTLTNLEDSAMISLPSARHVMLRNKGALARVIV